MPNGDETKVTVEAEPELTIADVADLIFQVLSTDLIFRSWFSEDVRIHKLRENVGNIGARLRRQGMVQFPEPGDFEPQD